MVTGHGVATAGSSHTARHGGCRKISAVRSRSWGAWDRQRVTGPGGEGSEPRFLEWIMAPPHNTVNLLKPTA